MAITINGSANTVAGVAAGGINDNVVDNGTMADNAIDSAELVAGAVDLAHLSATGTASSSTFLRGDNAWATPSDNGKILQVVQTVKSDTTSREASGWADIAGMSVTIRPASGTKVLVHYSIHTSHTNGARFSHTKLVRDSTDIAIGDADGSRSRSTTAVGTPAGNGDYMIQNQTMVFLDTHGANGSTDVVYKLQWWIDDSSSQSAVFLNRALADMGSVARTSRSVSTITAVEVAA